MNTTITIDRAKRLAKLHQSFMAQLLEREFQLKGSQGVIAAGFGHPDWAGLAGAVKDGDAMAWDRASAYDALQECFEPPLSAAAATSSLLAVESLLDPVPLPSLEVVREVLSKSQLVIHDDAPRPLLAAWMEDLPDLCRRRGFAQVCAGVIRAATEDPDGFVSLNVKAAGGLVSSRSSRQARAMRPALQGVRAELEALAARPLHPAWGPLVLWAIGLGSEVMGEDAQRALTRGEMREEDVGVLLVAGAFLARNSEGGERVPAVFADALWELRSSTRRKLIERAAIQVGPALLMAATQEYGKAPAPTSFARHPDLARSPFASFEGRDDHDRTPVLDDALGGAGRVGWHKLRDTDGSQRHGLWHRVTVDAAESASLWRHVTGATAGDLHSAGVGVSRSVHAVGYGPHADAVCPAGVATVLRGKSMSYGQASLEVIVERVGVGAHENDPFVHESLMCSIEDSTRIDVAGAQAGLDAHDGPAEVTVLYVTRPGVPNGFDGIIEAAGLDRASKREATAPAP